MRHECLIRPTNGAEICRPDKRSASGSLAFLEQGGKEVIITTPECLPAALRGETGTHIIKT
ncbi:hypothetical protein E4513_17255 [Escherichia coli]|nr:hypothetical protein [Escherichia coli]